MNSKKKWDKLQLHKYLLYGNWMPSNAFRILAGLDYNIPKINSGSLLTSLSIHGSSLENHQHIAHSTLTPSQGITFKFPDTAPEEPEVTISNGCIAVENIQFKEKIAELLSEFWISDSQDFDTKHSPEFFIKFAVSKNLQPEWLDWAIQEGLYKPDTTTIATIKTHAINETLGCFNDSSNTYPPELDIAMQVWREVSTTEGKGKPKARIKTWLDENTNLSTEAKKRISIVANWEKRGGATRSD